MRSIRQSALAVMMALVSTAAFGPGTFFAERVEAPGRRPLRAALPDAPTSLDLQAFMRYAQPRRVAGMPVALPGDELPEIADFLAVDLKQASGNDAVLLVAGPAFFPGITGGEGLLAGVGYGYGYGYGNGYGNGSALTGSARASGQNTQPASDSRLPAGMAGPLSGFNAGPAPAGFSAISLDDPALIDRSIEQLPHLALAPTVGDVEAGSQAGNGAAHAVPEPTTLLLLGLGLLGLLATRQVQGGQPVPLDPALPL